MSKCPHLTRLGESGSEHTGLTAPPCLQFPPPFKDQSLKRTQENGHAHWVPPTLQPEPIPASPRPEAASLSSGNVCE